MRILVTAGNTQVPIDRVRCITNIFTGRTGAHIALRAHVAGHDVRLLTSHPEVVERLAPGGQAPAERWSVQSYRTFDELRDALQASLTAGAPDAVIHSAAVSDYQSGGIFAPAEGTAFDMPAHVWTAARGAPKLADVTADKVKSDAPELWLRLVRTPKLIDLMRQEWGFRGVLVKFKLEVGVSEERLREIAERSRIQSAADLMVANTLEGAAEWALLGPLDGSYRRIAREDLPALLVEAIENHYRETAGG